MLERIRDILVEYVDVPREQITLATNLLSDLGLSSLDIVDVIVAFEEEFGIEVPDRKFSRIVTVEDVVRMLEEYEIG